MDIPAWLQHRARLHDFSRVYVLLPPASPTSAAIYLLEKHFPLEKIGVGADYELHAVTDAASGIEGATIPLTRKEACDLLLTFAGVLSGRLVMEEACDLTKPFPAPPLQETPAEVSS